MRLSYFDFFVGTCCVHDNIETIKMNRRQKRLVRIMYYIILLYFVNFKNDDTVQCVMLGARRKHNNICKTVYSLSITKSKIIGHKSEWGHSWGIQIKLEGCILWNVPHIRLFGGGNLTWVINLLRYWIIFTLTISQKNWKSLEMIG